MSAIKWIKIVTDIFDDEKMLLIESLPGADSIIVIWFKLLCLAGKNNNSGVFLLNGRIPYTDEMLATIFRRDLNTVRFALKTFEDFEMVEIINDTITIPNWSKHQTLDAYEKKKERDRIYQKQRREKQRLIALSTEKSSDTSSEKSSDVVALEEDKEKEEDKAKDIDINNIKEKWNSLNLNKLTSIKNKRLSHVKARIREVGEEGFIKAIENINRSSFLKGKNDRGWTISFDWFINPNNFIKVFEGNYIDKKGKGKDSKFFNFESHDYDYDDLEKKLLGWDEDDKEE